MKVKLKEMYDTKYFYKTFVIDLKYLFSSIETLRSNPDADIHPINDRMKDVFDAVRAGANIEFDLAGCVITPDCISCIVAGMTKGIRFCDTADASRDAIIVEDMQRLAMDTSNFVELPVYEPGNSIVGYVKALDKNVTYKLPVNDRHIYFPLTFIIQCSRPSIKISPGGLTNDFFRFIGADLTPADLDGFSEFYYATKEGVRIVRTNADGKIYDQKTGLVSIRDALSVGVLVPLVFGNEKTLHTQGLDIIFEKQLTYLQTLGQNKKITLAEYFE